MLTAVSPRSPRKGLFGILQEEIPSFFTSPYITANEISHWVWPCSNKDPYLDFNDCNHCLPFCKLIYFTEVEAAAALSRQCRPASAARDAVFNFGLFGEPG